MYIYVYFLSYFLLLTNSLGGKSGQFSLHLSYHGNSGLGELGGPGDAIYIPYLQLLVPHTAWLKQM